MAHSPQRHSELPWAVPAPACRPPLLWQRQQGAVLRLDTKGRTLTITMAVVQAPCLPYTLSVGNVALDHKLQAVAWMLPKCDALILDHTSSCSLMCVLATTTACTYQVWCPGRTRRQEALCIEDAWLPR